MEIWLDTLSLNEVTKYSFLLSGVTTNPQILSKTDDVEKTLKELLEVTPGPLAVQVLATTAPEMVLQGENLHQFSKKIIVKVPATHEGLQAIHTLAKKGIATMATCVFTVQQALLAAKAGASYIALYLTRLEKGGGDSNQLLEACSRMFKNYDLKAKLLAASLSRLEQFEKCLELGIAAVTLTPEMFQTLFSDPCLTQEALERFNQCMKAEDATLFKGRHVV